MRSQSGGVGFPVGHHLPQTCRSVPVEGSALIPMNVRFQMLTYFAHSSGKLEQYLVVIAGTCQSGTVTNI